MDLNDYYKGNKQFKTFLKEDGLVNDWCAISFIDSKDNLWIRTSKGVFINDIKNLKRNTSENITYLKGIKLFYKDVNWDSLGIRSDNHGIPEKLELPHHQNHLTFQFIGNCLSAPLSVKYQYMIKGLNDDWSPPVSQNEAVYSNIPPGTYTFMVRSCNDDGVWNKEPVMYEFTILKPFWRTNWFIGLIGSIVLFGLYIFIKWRERNLQQQMQVLENKVSMRTQELKVALDQVEEKQKEIVDSIRYAKRIQSAYLPPEQVFTHFFKVAFLLLKPNAIFSVDFYWYYSPDKQNIYCAVADCTGHGVPGALMSVICCNALNEVVVSNKVYDTDKILNEARTLVKKSLKSTSFSGQKDGMDIALIKLNLNTNQLSYSGAYNSIWIIKEKELIELPADKQPIGAFENETDFTCKTLQLSKGDIIYLFSDGFADQFGGPKGKKFKYKAFSQCLLDNAHLPLEEQKQLLLNTFNNWKGELEQVDDVCIIGIRL